MTSDTRWQGSMPEVYDRCLGPALFAPYAEELARRAAALAPTQVLELAAGTGILTSALVQAGLSVVATDLNEAMVAWGAERVPGATWRQADAAALDVPTASVDLVVSQFGVMFFPDKVAAHAEAARVLRPGGTSLFAVWDDVGGSTFTVAMVAALAEVLPQDPPGFIVRVPHGYADPAAVEADVVAGGLLPLSVERVVLPTSSPSAAVLAEGFALGTPLRFALAERRSLEELVPALAAAMSGRLGEGPVTGELAAWVVTARRPG